MTPRQLPLDLPVRSALGVDDFLVTPSNAAAVTWLDRWPDWPAPALCLVGPDGCGKTHLAHVFAERSGAVITQASDLTEAAVPDLVGDGLGGDGRAVVVEDCGGALNETALFHLFNLVKETGGALLMTAREAPARWPVALPDLRSRLATAPVVEIAPPDDALIAAVLIKQFADRQLTVGEDVVTYLLRHMERSFAAVRDVVDGADRLALAKGKRVTVPLVKEVLAQTRSV